MEFAGRVTNDHIAAYAAMSSFFFVLAMIPIILLLLTIVRFTPVTKADTMTAVMTVFPDSVTSLITSIVNQVYNQSMSIIPITIIVALWSAGKGVLAINSGLNVVYRCRETRNYFYLRIRSTIYTLMFILMIIVMLVLSVFGDSLAVWVNGRFPFLIPITNVIMSWRTVFTVAVMFVFMTLVYKYMPNRKSRMKREYIGSIFSIVYWMVLSYIFSVYLDIFTGFSTMYGSMATLILIMMWLYFGMYGILMGSEINQMLEDHRQAKKSEEKSS